MQTVLACLDAACFTHSHDLIAALRASLQKQVTCTRLQISSQPRRRLGLLHRVIDAVDTSRPLYLLANYLSQAVLMATRAAPGRLHRSQPGTL